jgi:hypothetical protein
MLFRAPTSSHSQPQHVSCKVGVALGGLFYAQLHHQAVRATTLLDYSLHSSNKGGKLAEHESRTVDSSSSTSGVSSD